MAKTFVLVGDHFQLPPLVQNKEAQEGGLDVSLFKILSEQHPESVTTLEHQYRMNADVMLLSNTLIYSGRLKCGTQKVAERRLHIPRLETGLAAFHYSSQISSDPASGLCRNSDACWLRRCLVPEQTVMFLNTDQIEPKSTEIVTGSRIVNPCEADLTAQIVSMLVASGIAPREIGVITFYRSQLALLRQQLGTKFSEVEMHTADKFQGRDKEVIVLSCVRNNDSGNIGDLLKDWRRVNVALTRARSKLLIIGSKRTLAKSQNDVLEKLVELVSAKAWVHDLPKHSLQGHLFDMQTQTTGQMSSQSPAPEQRKVSKRWDSPEADHNTSTSKSTTTHSPLRAIEGNSQRVKPGGMTTMKTPKKIGKGMDAARLLDTRPLMKDLIHDMS